MDSNRRETDGIRINSWRIWTGGPDHLWVFSYWHSWRIRPACAGLFPLGQVLQIRSSMMILSAGPDPIICRAIVLSGLSPVDFACRCLSLTDTACPILIIWSRLKIQQEVKCSKPTLNRGKPLSFCRIDFRFKQIVRRRRHPPGPPFSKPDIPEKPATSPKLARNFPGTSPLRESVFGPRSAVLMNRKQHQSCDVFQLFGNFVCFYVSSGYVVSSGGVECISGKPSYHRH